MKKMITIWNIITERVRRFIKEHIVDDDPYDKIERND
tara:strand:+ start:2553 stop:2663 length:111 start_codon:yes stop_codon:yes gene_type:complete